MALLTRRNRQQQDTVIDNPEGHTIEEIRQYLHDNGIDLSHDPDWLVWDFVRLIQKDGMEVAQMTYQSSMNLLAYRKNRTPAQIQHDQLAAKEHRAAGLYF